jgi:mannose-1-phosphate guanylyltransferase
MNAGPAAFVLAAGLGTRLAPLTDILPKPLVPVFHKPLLTFALDSLIAAGAGPIALNTHHLPSAFAGILGAEPSYRGRPLSMFHEPRLLDTGGGIRNARPALGDSAFFLYNGDILADMPLRELLGRHRESGSLATLLLRPGGGRTNILFDPSAGAIRDLRGELGAAGGIPVVYAGIALLEQGIFDWIPAEGPFSVIDALLSALRSGQRVGGFLVEEGLWIDLGTPSSYLEGHRILSAGPTPCYLEEAAWPEPVHPTAMLFPGAILEGTVAVGPGAVVGKDARIRDSVIWPGAIIGAGAVIEGCVVSGRSPVGGIHRGEVL